MYAYAARLLVFGVSLTSVSLSKIIFLTDCKRAAMPLFFRVSKNPQTVKTQVLGFGVFLVHTDLKKYMISKLYKDKSLLCKAF